MFSVMQGNQFMFESSKFHRRLKQRLELLPSQQYAVYALSNRMPRSMVFTSVFVMMVVLSFCESDLRVLSSTHRIREGGPRED